jgi:hypothetical protein
MAVGMDSISDTRFKLHEAAYFLSQMKNNVGDKTDFIFNLIAFVSAARSVTYVMQSQYKKSEDPFWRWYVPNVQEALAKEDDALFLHSMRVKFLKQKGNPRQDMRQLVTKTVIARYNIAGAESEKKEEKLPEQHSQQESPSQQQQEPPPPNPTMTDDPDAQEPNKKYIWYVEDVEDKTKSTRKYVIPTCEGYLQRLTGIIDECERNFGQA